MESWERGSDFGGDGSVHSYPRRDYSQDTRHRAGMTGLAVEYTCAVVPSHLWQRRSQDHCTWLRLCDSRLCSRVCQSAIHHGRRNVACTCAEHCGVASCRLELSSSRFAAFLAAATTPQTPIT